MMRLFGGQEPKEAVRKATMDLTAALYQKQVNDFEFNEISELERDSYGRILVFTRFKSGDHDGQLLLIFTSVDSDGSFRASPKCYLEVRTASFGAGVEHHKIRNSWNCPIDSTPIF